MAAGRSKALLDDQGEPVVVVSDENGYYSIPSAPPAAIGLSSSVHKALWLVSLRERVVRSRY